jgi:hypothetical protein
MDPELVKTAIEAVPAVAGAAGATVVVKRAVNFLSRLLGPATDEAALYFRDRVAAWRAANATRIAAIAEEELSRRGLAAGDVTVSPRLGIAILDEGSKTDDAVLQGMWAGLLASSATSDGQDESNLMFTDMLGRLTGSQARLLEFLCEKAEKGRTKSGLILAVAQIMLPVEGAKEIAKVPDLHQLDRELDYLRTLGLIDGGLSPDEVEDEPPPPVRLVPTALALHMYARCRGERDPLAFYGLVDAAPVRVIAQHLLGGGMVIRSTQKQ